MARRKIHFKTKREAMAYYNTLPTSTLIVVEFFRKMNGRKVWYFGSLAAIYELFTPEQIGCKLETLWNYSLDYGGCKITNTCVISKEMIYRKAHKVKKN